MATDTLTATPLAEMTDGDLSELSIAPLWGLKVNDQDCCATEAWILVGPSLDSDTLGVEVVEARWRGYVPRCPDWEVVEGVDCLTLAEVVSVVAEFAADPGYGHLPCRCDWEA
jgi:hypothetical protein